MSARRLRILVLSSWFPYPPTNGSKLRVYQLLQQLGAGHDVTFVGLLDSADADPDHPAVRGLCRAIEVWPRTFFEPRGALARLAFLHPWPRSVVATRCAAMAAGVARHLENERFDLVIACQLDAARYIPPGRRVPALLEEVELAGLYEQFAKAPGVRARIRHGLTWAKQRRYVAALLRRFDACTVVSERERQLLQGVVGSRCPVTVVPNGVVVPAAPPDEARPAARLMFNGTLRYDANYDGLMWFVESVLPRVRAEVPDVELQVTGDAAGRRVPGQDGVVSLGIVPDVRAALSAASVAIVPLHVGGGTRFKILDAFATATPVVSTRKGAEGLDVVAGRHLLLADTAADFAAAIVGLLRDSRRAREIGRSGWELARDQYDWQRIAPRFEELVRQVAQCGAA